MSDTMQDVVNDGIVIFASIESDIPIVQSKVLELTDIIDRGLALGMCTNARANVLKARVQAISGQLSSVLADTLILHNDCTKIAQEKGVDVPDPNGGTSRTTF